MTNPLKDIQKKVKENISSLIEKGDLQEAKTLIAEYENTIFNDVDIYSMKGIIVMIEGNVNEAERILIEGLNIDEGNFDLLYNLGYLYQSDARVELAVKYYKRALQNAKNENEADEVSGILQGLGVEKSETGYLKDEMPNTSIVILTYNNLDYNKLCIESIRKYTRNGTNEIIVVDNHSTDGTVDWLKEQKDLKIILNDKNLGFPKGCNQGIEVAERDNDILLLNNDTIVTPDWLTNLKKCLYSESLIGAVGSVTNSCSNYQAIPVKYNNIEEMVDFARSHNISNPVKWEERLRLVGFCMLIKNEVVRKVGLLDEIFTPGNFEDDDYCLRIRKAGYKLILCKDSFIHHFGSASFRKVSKEYSGLLMNNRNKFAQKWGCDPYYIIEMRKDITELISKTALKNIRVLHIGCAGGGTLLDIKNAIPSAELYGIEPMNQVIVNTGHFAHIETGGQERINTFKKENFDFVIITQQQDDRKGIISALKYIKDYLKNNGILYFVLPQNNPNSNRKLIEELGNTITDHNFKVIETDKHQILLMEKVMDGKSGNTTKLTLYKREDMDKLDTEEVQNLEACGDNALAAIIRRLDNKIEFDKNMGYLVELVTKNKVDCERIKDIIRKNGIDKTELFNIMGTLFFQLNIFDKAIMFFKEAFKLNKENKDTIYNIAFVLHQLNENKAALDFIKQTNVIEEDLEIRQLRQQIEEAI